MGSPDPVEAAYLEGKFPAERRAHWQRQMGKKPKATKRVLASMAAVLPPPGGEDAEALEAMLADYGAAPVAAAPSGPTKYEKDWLSPAEQATAAAGSAVPGSGAILGENDSLTTGLHSSSHQAGTVPPRIGAGGIEIEPGPGEVL